MSDIGTGDLVEVVKPTLCCGSRKSIGMKFRVMAVTKDTKFGKCLTCEEILPKSAVVAHLWGGDTCEIERLKVIEKAPEMATENRQGRFA